jgi:hypothetical protein
VEPRNPPPRPSRALWIAALAVSLICVGALAIGYLTRDPDVKPQHLPNAASNSSSGFGTGILIGIAAGVAIGSAIALRKRDS